MGYVIHRCTDGGEAGKVVGMTRALRLVSLSQLHLCLGHQCHRHQQLRHCTMPATSRPLTTAMMIPSWVSTTLTTTLAAVTAASAISSAVLNMSQDATSAGLLTSTGCNTLTPTRGIPMYRAKGGPSAWRAQKHSSTPPHY